MLHTEPSFCIYSVDGGCEDEGKDQPDDQPREVSETTFTIGENMEADDFSFGKTGMGLIQEEGEEEKEFSGGLNGIQTLSVEGEVQLVSPSNHISGDSGVANFTSPNFDGIGDAEEYYKRMVGEFPSHPLFLSNYGQLLQSRGDLDGAEDYYLRATLADPEDGEVLLQYAKLTWELHHDQCKALSYFERAAEAAPNDSHILAAYARFLWEIDDDEEDGSQKHGTNEPENSITKEASKRVEEGVDVSVPNLDGSDGGEEYYKRMVDAFPSNPLFLRNYAQVLQSKGDLHGAEDYYFQATEANPEDGEILSQYAKLTWELHHDQCRAACYFERAAQAAPQDSYVLAAHARFLWEIDDDDEKEDEQNYIQTEKDHWMKENQPENLSSKEQSEQVNGGAYLSLPHIDSSGDVEDYYKRMVDEYPSHSLILRNYAHILQSKGNLEGAEEHFSRSIVADPGNGEIISQYAKFVWDFHNDRDKALCYFEQAVQASPENSDVLAANARFLWEAGEDEAEDIARQDHSQARSLHDGVATLTMS